MAVESLSARLTDEIRSREESLKSLEGWVSRLRDEEASKRTLLKEVGLPRDAAVEALKRMMDSLVEQLAEVQAEEEHAKREMATSDRRASTLTRESRCPLCLQPLPPSYKGDLLRRIRRETIEYKERMDELRRRAEDLERRKRTLSSVLSELQAIEARVEDVERQIEEERERLEKIKAEFDETGREAAEVRRRLVEMRAEMAKIDLRELEEAQRLRERAFDEYSGLKHSVRVVESQMREVASRMDSLKERLDSAYVKVERMKKVRRLLEILREIRQAYRSIQPRLRGEFVRYLERMVQQVLDELLGFGEPPLFVSIDEDYTPSIRSEEGHERSVANLSGGERTFLAFAYRMGVGQIIMQSRVGHGPRMLLLDEPTESLGREDGSIDRLAEALSRLKTVEQIIAVTHSEAFAEKADHVARVTKENNVSKVLVER
jgi:exonuclease SbcC